MTREDPPHRKRLRRIEKEGHAHALTFSCFRRRPFLSKDRSRRWMIEAIDRARSTCGFHLWAFVVMPEHVHLLIHPGAAGASVGSVLSAVKQSVSQRAIRFLKEQAPEYLRRLEDRRPDGAVVHRFWMRGGGYDANVVDARVLRFEIDYIHANPVRRGLCARPTDWEWSSAREYESQDAGVLRIDRDSLP